MQTAEVTHTYTMFDLLYSALTFWRRENVLKLLLAFLILVALATGMIALYLRFPGLQNLMVDVALVLVCMGYAVWVGVRTALPGIKTDVKRRVDDEVNASKGLRKFLAEPQTLRIEPGGIRHREGADDRVSPWQPVTEIFADRRLLYVVTTDDMYVVPRRAFGSRERYHAFVTLAHRYRDAAHRHGFLLV